MRNTITISSTILSLRGAAERALGSVLMVMVAGCAHTSPQPASVETAKLAIREAARSEAPRLATVDYQLAREKLERAENATERGDKTAARRLAEEATVDARFAQAHAQAEQASRAAIETESTAQSLRSGRGALRSGGGSYE